MTWVPRGEAAWITTAIPSCGSLQRHRAAPGRRDPRHKGGPGVPRTLRVSPGAKLHGLSLGCPRPSPPCGARGGTWTHRSAGGRAGGMDRQTARAAGAGDPAGGGGAAAAPLRHNAAGRPAPHPGPPKRARAGGDAWDGGTLSSETRSPGRTDSDRPQLRPGPAHAPRLQTPSPVSPDTEPAAYAYLARLPPPRRLGSSPQALSPRPLPLLAPSSHFLPRLPSGFAASPPAPPACSFLLGNEISPHRDP